MTTVFPYTFKILADADMRVTVDGVVLALGVDFTVSGAGNATGGNVTIISGAPANGKAVVRRRKMALSRDTNFQDQAGIPADTLNADLDRLVMMAQQVDYSSSAEAWATASAGSATAAAASAVASAANAGANNTALTTAPEIDVASASTTTIGGLSSNKLRITGTTGITSFGTVYNGPIFIRFAAGLTLTHNATSLILPGGNNMTVVAGDTIIAWPKATTGTANGWVVFSSGFAPPAFLGDGSSFISPGLYTGYGIEFGSMSGVYTAPRSGYYFLSAEFERTTGGTAGVSVGAIKVNGTDTVKAKCTFAAADAVPEVFTASGLVYVNAGWTVQASLTSSTGTFNSVKCNRFSGFFVKG